MDNKPYFRHFVVEIEASFEEADSLEWIKTISNKFIEKLGIKVINSVEHRFQPQGISLLYIISSSHMAIHTWPENNYIHIELITCSQDIELEKIKTIIEEMLSNRKYNLLNIGY